MLTRLCGVMDIEQVVMTTKCSSGRLCIIKTSTAVRSKLIVEAVVSSVPNPLPVTAPLKTPEASVRFY